jgi:hypothetical protein
LDDRRRLEISGSYPQGVAPATEFKVLASKGQIERIRRKNFRGQAKFIEILFGLVS